MHLSSAVCGPLLLFHEQRHPVNHIRADTLITREHVSHGGLTPVQRHFIWGPPIFRTRVARYRSRSTCARKATREVISIHRSAPETLARAAYTGSNGGFIASASITARVTPVMSPGFFILLARLSSRAAVMTSDAAQALNSTCRVWVYERVYASGILLVGVHGIFD